MSAASAVQIDHGQHAPAIRRIAAGALQRGQRAGALLLFSRADHIHIDIAAAPHQLIHGRPEDDLLPARPLGLADHNLGDIAGARVVQDRVAGALPAERHRLGAQLLGQPQRLDELLALRLGQAHGFGRLDRHDDPFGAHGRGHAPRRAHQPRAERARADADQQPLVGGPGLGDRVVLAIVLHLRVDAVGGAAQRQLAQRDQVALAKEVLHRALGLLRQIDLALLQPLEQVIGRQVDQLDLVGLLDDPIRHGLAHDHAGDLGDHIVQALDMLDVDGGVDIDAGLQQLLDILPALGVARAGRVGMRQLVHQDQLRPARQRGVDIELLDRRAVIFDLPAREQLETVHQRLGLGAPVGLDIAGQHIDAGAALLVGGLEHGVGFAHAGRCAKEDLQPAARLPAFIGLDAREQQVGIGTIFHS